MERQEKMKEDERDRINNINRYVKEISELLPYPSSLKNNLLKGLRMDIQSAMEDSKSNNPSMVFGSARDVAKNFTKSQEWGTERAGWWTRIAAYLIDMVILGFFMLFYTGGGILALLALFVPIDQLSEFFASSWNEPIAMKLDLTFLEVIVFLTVLFFIFGSTILIFFGYLVMLERYYSATMGKKLLKLSVVDVSGIKITWQQAIVRNLTKIFGGFLPVDVILGIILEQQNPEKTQRQRGFDILAETIVVKHA